MRVVYISGLITLSLGCSNPKKLDSIVLDPTRRYDILHEDSLTNYYDEPKRITADLFIDDCSTERQMCDIEFAEAKLEHDTLSIEVSQTNSIDDYHYKIKIINGHFMINYWYQTTMDTSIRVIQTLKQTLILNNSKFKKGETIKGHTEYIGQCIKGCVTDEMKPIHIKGNFKITVR
jgi:hypothetical protein